MHSSYFGGRRAPSTLLSNRFAREFAGTDVLRFPRFFLAFGDVLRAVPVLTRESPWRPLSSRSPGAGSSAVSSQIDPAPRFRGESEERILAFFFAIVLRSTLSCPSFASLPPTLFCAGEAPGFTSLQIFCLVLDA